MGQCEALAEATGLPYRFTEERALPEGEPALIFSFGSAVQRALLLQKTFGGRPRIVQFGRPRLIALSRLDLIILMPQDDFPPARNVIQLTMPLNGASLQHPFVMPRPARPDRSTTVLLGGPTRHFAYDREDIECMLGQAEELARLNGEVLRVVPGPRTPESIRSLLLARYAACPETVDFRRLRDILESSNRLVVTADSASLIADAWRSGCPTWLYRLKPLFPPVQKLKIAFNRIAPALRYALIRRGWLAGGTDFLRWHEVLLQEGLVRALNGAGLAEPDWHRTDPMPDNELVLCRDRVLAPIA